MERPHKRPRLHFLGSVSPEPDEELDVARQRNDNLLKTKWENIFSKYEKDFTGIGDEIGMLSSELVVDNGHIRSLQTEGATGDVWGGASAFDGRKMLRAMTCAPSEDMDTLPDANEVLQSIETMTDIAMLSDLSSEDDLFEEDAGEQSSTYDSDDDPSQQNRAGGVAGPWPSSRQTRSESPDSLFDVEAPESDREREQSSKTTVGMETPSIKAEQPQIYKSTIRDEVRKILEEERAQWSGLEDESVDPAWRVPVRIEQIALEAATTVSMNQTPSHVDNTASDLPEPDDSLWAAPTRYRRTKREVAAERNMRRIREESEDPLQEGFSSDPEDCLRQTDKGLERTSNQGMSMQPSVWQYDRPDESVQYFGSATDDEDGDYIEEDEHLVAGDGDSGDVEHAVADSIRRFEGAGNAYNDDETNDNDNYHDDDYEHHEDDTANSQARRRYVPSPPPKMMQKEFSSRSILSSTNSYDGMDEAGDPQTPEICLPNRRMPRLSSYETTADRSNHPWQTPFTRAGNPLGRRSLKQRETVVSRMAERAKTTALEDDLQYDEQFENVDDSVVRELERRRIQGPMDRGICYYCGNSHVDRSGVGAHWDRILTNFTLQVLPDDDPHDIPYLHSVRAQVERRIRPPKTIVADFKLYVQLHEGSGVSFDRIVATQLLYTNKNADRVEIEYHQYRQQAHIQPQWTKAEDKELRNILHAHLVAEGGNKQLTMIRLHKDLKIRRKISFLDLGNKLAEIFLEELACNTQLRSQLEELLKQPAKSRARRGAARISGRQLLDSSIAMIGGDGTARSEKTSQEPEVIWRGVPATTVTENTNAYINRRHP